MEHILTVYQSEFHKQRIGSARDGGYVICDLPGIRYDLFISCGIANNTEFENDFLKLYDGIDCVAFDGTIDALPPTTNKHVKWFKKNIGDEDTRNETNLHTFLTIYNNIFLKMDIEGFEIPWLTSLDAVHMDSLAQIVLEFHWPFGPREYDVFEKLNKTHVLVHFHQNNNNGFRRYLNTIVPDVFECTYIHKRFFKNPLVKNKELIPTPLDVPNLEGLIDIPLHFPPYVDTDDLSTYYAICHFLDNLKN